MAVKADDPRNLLHAPMTSATGDEDNDIDRLGNQRAGNGDGDLLDQLLQPDQGTMLNRRARWQCRPDARYPIS